MISTRRIASILSLAVLLLPPAIVLSQERVGVSCADCPNLSGAFSIDNQTHITLPYQVKWGKDRDWKAFTLAAGHTMTHSYPLDGNRKAPAPYIRFDSVGGDS